MNKLIQNIWVCRPGKKCVVYNYFVEQSKITCAWQGFNFSWDNLSKDELKEKINATKHVDNRTTLANWVGQIIYFRDDMKIGDLVLVPNSAEKKWIYGTVESNYQYIEANSDETKHERKVLWLGTINGEDLTQSLKYTLGAFRTIFKIRKEEHISEIGNLIGR